MNANRAIARIIPSGGGPVAGVGGCALSVTASGVSGRVGGVLSPLEGDGSAAGGPVGVTTGSFGVSGRVTVFDMPNTTTRIATIVKATNSIQTGKHANKTVIG